MATADQMKALIRRHAEGDESHFYAVAMQVAARAARSGQTKFAQELRDVVDAAKVTSQSGGGRRVRPVPVAQPRGDLAGLLGVTYPSQRLSNLVVDVDVKTHLERVLAEQRQRERLLEHGFDPLHSLLLIGPPGTGKTLTASILAGELRLPLFLIRLDALITKFMGETASKLRMIFDAVEETRGVYLFDEVDALAGDRSTKNDVGEIRRVLNSFLMFLEHDGSSSVLVAATNHPQLLDKAVFRRFGAVIRYPMPTTEIAREVIRNRLASLNTKGLGWKAIDESSAGLSHADLTLACEQAAKQMILARAPRLTTAAVVAALQERHRAVTNS